MEVEKLQVRFKFLFGSVQQGNVAFANLTKFASKVPFSLNKSAAPIPPEKALCICSEAVAKSKPEITAALPCHETN